MKALALGLFALVVACSAAQATSNLPDLTAQQVARAAFGHDDLSCVLNNSSRAQADTCRAEVHAYWCAHGLKDACASDGGAE